MLSNLLTVNEAAEVARQSPVTIRRKIHDGELRALRLGRAAAGRCASPPTSFSDT